MSDADNQTGGQGGQWGKDPAEEDDQAPDPQRGNVDGRGDASPTNATPEPTTPPDQPSA